MHMSIRCVCVSLPFNEQCPLNEHAVTLLLLLGHHHHQVHHPSLPGCPGHEAACKQMTGGYGAMFSFEVDSEELAKQLPHRTRLFVDATSLVMLCPYSPPLLMMLLLLMMMMMMMVVVMMLVVMMVMVMVMVMMMMMMMMMMVMMMMMMIQYVRQQQFTPLARL